MDSFVCFIDVTGRSIYLSKERWKHIQRHRHISDSMEKIKETLIKPDVITTIQYDEDVRFYHRYYTDERQFLFVSIKYCKGHGFIITAFYTNKIQ